MAILLGRMFWTDKGPKYLVMAIILSLSIYMFSALLGSKKVAEDLNNKILVVLFIIAILFVIYASYS